MLQDFSPQIEQAIERALSEDLGCGDATTEILIPDDSASTASLLAKEDGVLAGIEVAKVVFKRVDHSLKVDILRQDGMKIKKGDIIATIHGSTRSILKAERTALNFLQRLSGIATETRRYVEAVSGLAAKIVDTRKTAPGLRALDKWAVRLGGGQNHRQHLGDGILIKDNHITSLKTCGLSLREIILKARREASHTLKIEVEVETFDDAIEAWHAGADIIMLDNMAVDEMRRVVDMIKDSALLEASGGIDISTVRAVAETGVHLISVGSLTHSPKALDISLELEHQ